MRAANQLPAGGPLMWMMPLNLHVNQKSGYDDDEIVTCGTSVYTMDHPKFVVSNQEEEFISTFWVKSAFLKRMAVEMI